MHIKTLLAFTTVLFSLFSRPIKSTSADYISNKNELLEKIAEVESGEEKTILVDRIDYSGPMLFDIGDKNITIEGKDSSSGFVNSTMGCIMITGTSESDKSGAITFKNVLFKTELADYNEDDSYSSSMLYGIKVDSGNINVNFEDCLFDGFRYGKGSGGAIQVIYSNSGNENFKTKINVSNSKFTDNVSISGGAIYATGVENVKLNITNCEFFSNHSTKGTIFASGIDLFVKNSKFYDNDDYEGCKTDYAHIGGAIASINSSINIIDSIFDDNKGLSIITLEKCKGYFINNSIRNNASSSTCLSIKNSGTKTVLFFNNLFDLNTNLCERYFDCERAESNYETELRTKFYFNTFNNTGTDHEINNDHVFSFGNLFINPSVTAFSFPKQENNYNTILNNIINVEDNLENMVIDNEIIKEDFTLFETYIGTFYSKQNELTRELKVDGESICIDSLTHKNKFGFDFENYYYNGEVLSINKTLISKIGNNDIEAKYNLNSTGVLLFIVGPVLLITLVCLYFSISFVLKKRKKSVELEISDCETNEIKELNSANEVNSIDSEIISCLSSREMEVFNLLLDAVDRKEIAEKLFVSESTVKKHIASIYSKLDVKNRIELFLKVRNKK